MPLMIKTIGRPNLRASAGVRTPWADSAHTGMSRRFGLVPNDEICSRRSLRAARPARNSITCACSEVSWYAVASARVCSIARWSHRARRATVAEGALGARGCSADAGRQRARDPQLGLAGLSALGLDLDFDGLDV